MLTIRSRGIDSTDVWPCSGSKRTSSIVSLWGGLVRSSESLAPSRRSEPSTRKVFGPPLYCGVTRLFGALIWLILGNTSSASPLTVLSATVAVAPALIAMISAAAIKKRFHMAHHRAGGRSSVGCPWEGELMDAGRRPRPAACRGPSRRGLHPAEGRRH